MIQLHAFGRAIETGEGRDWLHNSMLATWVLMEACNESARTGTRVDVKAMHGDSLGWRKPSLPLHQTAYSRAVAPSQSRPHSLAATSARCRGPATVRLTAHLRARQTKAQLLDAEIAASLERLGIGDCL